MNNVKNVTYFPEKLTKDSLVIINYFGPLNTSEKLYIEYFYDENSIDNNSIRKAEMSKVTDYSFVLVSPEYASNLYFRFVDDNGNFDDNNGKFYQKIVEESSEKIYSEPSSLLSEYKKSNNNSHIATNNTQKLYDEDFENEYEPITNMALVPIKERRLARKGLRFSYKLNKRIKLLLIKLPSFITGNYRRRINL